MPPKPYLPELLGSISISPSGEVPAGSYQSLTIVYVAGKFGIDDTGIVRLTWRTTSDMGKPQFSDPKAANYTTVEASNGAVLECSVDRIHTRPWANALSIRVGRGFLRAGETITVRLGDKRGGSPGFRLQTNVEPAFELKTFVDAFATCEFTELPASPRLRLVAGEAKRWKALLPSQNIAGERFQLCIVAEDVWGNPTGKGLLPIQLKPSIAVEGLPGGMLNLRDDGTLVVKGLKTTSPGDLTVEVIAEGGSALCRSTPMRIVKGAAFRHYWGDLHAQSGETIGTNPAADYFAYARDKAFLDIVGHQGNDFQITDAFWAELNRLTAAYDAPGRFVAVPGYEWSGNTGLGGDRNVFYRNEGRPIRRSSRILVDDPADNDCYTAGDLFKAMRAANEDAVVIAHVGGRYADIRVAHDGRLERAVEVHSTWGTFEWLLHDAFDLGYRPGIVCHSDDHKGRPGATMPGASTFGAIGGLTCYLMPELNRDALFETLRARRHYGTTGTRLYLSVTGAFERPVTVFADDPALGPTTSKQQLSVTMGAIVQPEGAAMTFDVDVVAASPIERIDIFHGKEIVETVRPFASADLGRRIRVLWSGAEYRGRGREVIWRGSAKLTGNRIENVTPVNFLNPDRPLEFSREDGTISWQSVTTGNMAGFDLFVDQARSGKLAIKTNVASLDCDLSELDANEVIVDAGGLARLIRVYRLPEQSKATTMHVGHKVAAGQIKADLPVYVRVTQEDGHQAWSSPIYLIAAA
jgi:hypothetical protein